MNRGGQDGDVFATGCDLKDDEAGTANPLPWHGHPSPGVVMSQARQGVRVTFRASVLNRSPFA